MIQQLRNVFSSLVIHKDTNDPLNPNYKWFITENHEVIGIDEEELTSKDRSLLEAFLTPYEVQFPLLTSEENKWNAIIHQNEEFDKESNFRFVYFNINRNQISPIQFKQAICEIFGRDIPILWESEFEGIIIEEKLIHEEIISYEQIIDILMSDLYVKIKFLVGTFQNDILDIQQYYSNLLKAAKLAFKYSNKNVMTYVDAIPYIFINETPDEQSRFISESILQDYLNDEETMKMIEAFVSSNLNVSETAKTLHMHRNSLQYRIERFYEKTGLNIRKFKHAMTVYLALLSKNKHDAQRLD